jgi:DNA-3-methyladenine glycosylase
MTRLPRDFFLRKTLSVAQDLLGKQLVFHGHEGIITETEGYIGFDDEACHAARGKTPRNAMMFALGGYTYVYFIYGMYFCLNVVTETEGFPAAVLIRGLFLLSPEYKNLDGPGRLCKNLGITKQHNGMDLTTSSYFYIKDTHLKPSFIATPRVGIKVSRDKLWRFVCNKENFTTTFGIT